jgi:hypothetical protein
VNGYDSLIIYRVQKDLSPLGQHKEHYVASLISCQRYRTQKDVYRSQFALFLKISQPAVSLAIKRGEQLVIRHNSR